MNYEFFHSPIHGIGCRATRNIKKNEVVGEEPYILLKNFNLLSRTKINDYWWNGKDYNIKGNILINGLGSFCNHSDNNNLNNMLIPDKNLIRFTANKDIEKGEELFNNYGKHWWELRKKMKNQRLNKYSFLM